MGHGIDSRSASRRSRCRSGWHQPSTDPRTMSAGMHRRIEPHHWKAYSRQALPTEGRVALEGEVRLEERAHGTGQAGSP
jgi:hypothetical protein